MFAARDRRGSPASTVPIVPMAHEYLVTEADAACRSTCRRCAIPSSSSTSARSPAAWSWAATSATRRRGALDGIPPDFNGKLLDGGLAALRGADRERRSCACRRSRRCRGRAAHQRPGGVHARTASSSSASPTCAASGSPPASAPTASPAPAGWASSSPSGSSRATPALDVWHMDIRRFGAAVPVAGATRSPAPTRSTRRTTTSSTPATSAQAGRPLRLSPAYARLARARRGVRREVGLGAGELVRAERGRAATRRCGRAAGRGGTGRRRSAPSTAPAARPPALFDETSFAKLEVVGRGRGRVPRAALRQPRRPRRRRDHLHADAQRARRDRVRLHRHAARRGPLPHRHRHGVRPATTWPGSAQHAPDDGSVHVDDVTVAATRASALWGPRARDDPRSRSRRRPLERGVPVHARRASSRSAPCPCSRCASPTSASSAGSSTARPSSGSRCGTRSGRRAASTGSSPAATGRSTRCGSRRATASGAPTSRPTTRPYEAGLGFAVKLDKGDFVGRDALVGAQARAATGGSRCLVARRPARGRARLRAGARRRRGRRPGDERRLRLHGRALDRVRLPARRARRAGHARSRSRSSASGWRARSPREPLCDPAGERIRA